MQGRNLSEIRQAAYDTLKTYTSQLLDSIERSEGAEVKGAALIKWQESIFSYDPKAETIDEDFNNFEDDFYRIKDELQTKKIEAYDGTLVDQIVGTLSDYSNKLNAYMAQRHGKTQPLNEADMESAKQTVGASIDEFEKIFDGIDSIEGFLAAALTHKFIIARNALITSYETIHRSQADYKESKESADDKIKGILSKKLTEVIQAEMNDFNSKANQMISQLTNHYYPDEKSFEVGRKKCADDIEKLYSKKFPENAEDSIKALVESSVSENYLLQRSKIIKDAMGSIKKAQEEEQNRIKANELEKKVDALLAFEYPIALESLLKSEKNCEEAKEETVKAYALKKLDGLWQTYIGIDLGKKTRSMNTREKFEDMPEDSLEKIIQKESAAKSLNQMYGYSAIFSESLSNKNINNKRRSEIDETITKIFSQNYSRHFQYLESAHEKVEAFLERADALKKPHEDKIREEAQKQREKEEKQQAIERSKKELERIVDGIKSIKDILNTGPLVTKKINALKQLTSNGEYKGSSFKLIKLFSTKLTQVVRSEINDFNKEVDQTIADWKKHKYSNKKTCHEEFKKCSSQVNLLLEQRFSRIKNMTENSHHRTSAYEDISNCEKMTKAKLKKALKEKKIEILENQINKLIGNANKQDAVFADFVIAEKNCDDEKDQKIKTKGLAILDLYWGDFVERQLNQEMESCGFQLDSKAYDLNPVEQFSAYLTKKDDPLSYNGEDLLKKKELADKIEKLCNFIPEHKLKLLEAKMTPERRKIFEEKIGNVFYQTGKLDDLPSRDELTRFRDRLKEEEYLKNKTSTLSTAAIIPSPQPTIQEQKEWKRSDLDLERKDMLIDLANLETEQPPPEELKAQPTPSGSIRKKIFAMIDPIGVSVILGTAGGALMGTFLFPGIGTLFGAAIGAASGWAAAILGILAVNIYQCICHPPRHVEPVVDLTKEKSVQIDEKHLQRPVSSTDKRVMEGLKESPKEIRQRRASNLAARRAKRKENKPLYVHTPDNANTYNTWRPDKLNSPSDADLAKDKVFRSYPN